MVLQAKKEEAFLMDEHTCGICYEDYQGHKFVKIPGCLHSFCIGCMKQMAMMHVKEGTIAELKCPHDK